MLVKIVSFLYFLLLLQTRLLQMSCNVQNRVIVPLVFAFCRCFPQLCLPEFFWQRITLGCLNMKYVLYVFVFEDVFAQTSNLSAKLCLSSKYDLNVLLHIVASFCFLYKRNCLIKKNLLIIFCVNFHKNIQYLLYFLLQF